MSEPRSSEPRLTPIRPDASGTLGISQSGPGGADGLRNLAIAVKTALSTGRAWQPSATDDASGQDRFLSEDDSHARGSALSASTCVSEPDLSVPDKVAGAIDALIGTQTSFSARLGAKPPPALVRSPVNSFFDLREPEDGRFVTVPDVKRPEREGVPPPARLEFLPSPEDSRPSRLLSASTAASIAAEESTGAASLKSLPPTTAHFRLSVDNTIYAAETAIRVAEEAMHAASLAPAASPGPSQGDNVTQLETLSEFERDLRLGLIVPIAAVIAMLVSVFVMIDFGGSQTKNRVGDRVPETAPLAPSLSQPQTEPRAEVSLSEIPAAGTSGVAPTVAETTSPTQRRTATRRGDGSVPGPFPADATLVPSQSLQDVDEARVGTAPDIAERTAAAVPPEQPLTAPRGSWESANSTTAATPTSAAIASTPAVPPGPPAADATWPPAQSLRGVDGARVATLTDTAVQPEPPPEPQESSHSTAAMSATAGRDGTGTAADFVPSGRPPTEPQDSSDSTAAKAATPSTPAAGAAPALGHSIDPEEIHRLRERGEALVLAGDIAAGRLVLQHAAQADDARAALVLGATYDPIFLDTLGVRGVTADPVAARAWYEAAKALGSDAAAKRLDRLADWMISNQRTAISR